MEKTSFTRQNYDKKILVENFYQYLAVSKDCYIFAGSFDSSCRFPSPPKLGGWGLNKRETDQKDQTRSMIKEANINSRNAMQKNS
ncbi:hypothetical protein, partial [Hoylesella enoeca]|uniref:hypothetical protein n=1 Tax=Hoylesella enoeca TaxID=76123 RepID=UPI001F302801